MKATIRRVFLCQWPLLFLLVGCPKSSTFDCDLPAERTTGTCSASEEGQLCPMSEDPFSPVLICHDGTWSVICPETPPQEGQACLYGNWSYPWCTYKSNNIAVHCAEAGTWEYKSLCPESIPASGEECWADSSEPCIYYPSETQRIEAVCELDDKWVLYPHDDAPAICSHVVDGRSLAACSGSETVACVENPARKPSERLAMAVTSLLYDCDHLVPAPACCWNNWVQFRLHFESGCVGTLEMLGYSTPCGTGGSSGWETPLMDCVEAALEGVTFSCGADVSCADVILYSNPNVFCD